MLSCDKSGNTLVHALLKGFISLESWTGVSSRRLERVQVVKQLKEIRKGILEVAGPDLAALKSLKCTTFNKEMRISTGKMVSMLEAQSRLAYGGPIPGGGRGRTQNVTPAMYLLKSRPAVRTFSYQLFFLAVCAFVYV